MKYLDLKTVVSAYNGCYNKTKNQFWGLLTILKAINCRVYPCSSYKFNGAVVSRHLDALFCPNTGVGDYRTDYYYATFSKEWIDKVPTLMLKDKPSIFDVCGWYFHNRSFDDQFTADDLVDLFFKEIKLTRDETANWFNFDIKPVEFYSTHFFDSELLSELGENGFVYPQDGSLSFDRKTGLTSKAGQLTAANFVQSLYSALNIEECLILSKFDFYSLYNSNLTENKIQSEPTENLQKIFYGAPGSGKSFKLKEEILPKNDKLVFRTTFHPDTDYSSFVGCYKPQMKDDKIVYAFAPQVFTDAYVAAWNGLENKETYYLVIEEINRGNCAQIFGDLFQLLDRKKGTGYSEYPIKADNDLRDYLEHAKTKDGGQVLINKEGIKDGKLCLPPNLNIIATMNTSDQSLFPMDSAFKRRWSWEYVPIKYDEPKSAAFTMNIPDSPFEKWVDFLKKINDIILEKTDSEDKQMGNFFIKGDIEEQEFKDKVMFYLWSEVCKDSFHTKDNFFRTKDREFSYNELYGDEGHDLLLGFLDYIKNYKAKDDQTV